MSQTILNRWLFALFGAATGYALWLLIDHIDTRETIGRPILFGLSLLTVFAAVFFALSGRLSLLRAGGRALLLALVVAGLVVLVSLRWSYLPEMLDGPSHFLVLCALTVLPVPFLLAQGEGNWRDYPLLFGVTWEIITRAMIACCFTVAVWVVIGLSALLLDIVGISVIEDLISSQMAQLVISGAAFGLAVALANEVSSMLSPRLAHSLLRLLLPLMTVVSAIFVGAVIWKGFDGSMRGLSPALVLLSISAAGIALVTVTYDADGESASKSPVILWSARGMVLLLPVLAGLSLRAIWLRINDQGLTPNRLFVLVLALIALVYGLTWLVALLRGRGFAARLRAANPWLALGVILCAMIWLTPLFNSEAISARDQANRVIDGRKPASEVGWRLFRGLGLAGEAERQRLQEHATLTGDRLMAARLEPDAPGGWNETETMPDPDRLPALRDALEESLPVQPASAGGTRRMLLDAMEEWHLDMIMPACADAAISPELGCLLVVGDMLPFLPGEEAVLLLVPLNGAVQGYGLWIGDDGRVTLRDLRMAEGRSVYPDDIKALLRRWRDAPPALAPARLNQLGSGDGGVLFVP